MTFFVLKPKYKFSKTTTIVLDNNHSIHYIQYRPTSIGACNNHVAHQSADHLLYNSAVQDVIILGVPDSAEVVYRVNVRGVTTWSDVLVVACTVDAEMGLQCAGVWS